MFKARFFSIAFIIMIVFMAGCSSGGSSSTSTSSSSSSGGVEVEAPTAPQITSEDRVLWDENRPFTHTVQAVGVGDLRFRLLDSGDNVLFTLEESTGLLTTTNALNFEAPGDENRDGIYELGVVVTDENDQTSVQDFQLEITDVDDITVEIIFPIDRSNLGGSVNSINVRGRIIENEKLVQGIPSNTILDVNGVQASILENGSGEWTAAIPVTSELTAISAELLVQNKVTASDNIELLNQYIEDPNFYETSGGDKLYGFSAGNLAVLEKNLLTGDVKVLLEINSIRETSGCFRFSRLLISPSEKKLAINCEVAYNAYKFYIYEIEFGELKTLDEEILVRFNSAWLDDKYYIPQISSNEFVILNTDSMSSKAVTVEFQDLEDSSCGNLPIYNYTVYIKPCNNELVSLDLQPVLDNPEVEVSVVASVIGGNATPSSNQAMIGATLYTLSNSELTVENILTGEIEHPTIKKGGEFISWWLDKASSGVLIEAYTDQKLYIKEIPGGEMFELDLSTYTLEPYYTHSSPMIKGYIDIAMNADGSKIAIYDPNYFQFLTVNIDSFTVNQFHDFSDIEETIQITDSRISYDWANEIIYRNQVLDWGGVAASEDAHIVAINVKSHTKSSVLNGNQLADILGEVGKYRMSDVRLTSTENEIVFSVLHVDAYTEYNPENGSPIDWPLNSSKVVSYNIASGQGHTIFELNESSSTWNFVGSDELRLSDYSESLDSISLTAPQNGFLTLLYLDGAANHIIDPLTPYIYSLDSEIDNTNNRIFMSAYPPSDPYAEPGSGYISPDYSSMEIIEVDIDTGRRKLVASRDKGNGLLFRWTRFQYDEPRDLLIDFNYGQFFIIDPNSGDRVIKPITGL